MNRYDPNRRPDARACLLLDEQEKIELVERYHERARVELPNPTLHAAMHVVENQIAMGEPPEVELSLSRLMSEGLDRHDALHAIGSVLAEHMYACLRSEGQPPAPSQYAERVLQLTAEGWRKS